MSRLYATALARGVVAGLGNAIPWLWDYALLLSGHVYVRVHCAAVKNRIGEATNCLPRFCYSRGNHYIKVGEVCDYSQHADLNTFVS